MQASALKEEMVSRGFLDATEFELVTVEDHPHQKTGYDCDVESECVYGGVYGVRAYGEVDVPSSNSALQSMLQAHDVPHDHGYELCPDRTMRLELKQGPGPRIKGIKFLDL
ncbi:hypothetical protein H6P81_009432 [Aristolochia fimbriata]|uniref:Uncharacterized protein n=1 Tax=Aristolochia fimbriata TaxID=158543 RepID=A0AAV7EKU8_ARIFI|nr:hypothetical protein H6P81_009432 [Aristolochia fimbriata]